MKQNLDYRSVVVELFPPAQVLEDRKVGLELGGQSAAYVTPQPRSRRSHK